MIANNNIRVYYVPPAGTPPAVFEFSSEYLVIMPPDQYWKMDFEEHAAPVATGKSGQAKAQRDEQTGEVLTYTARRMIWVPDDEKNEKMKAGEEPTPINYVDVAHGTWINMCKPSKVNKLPNGKYFHDYFKREDAVIGEHRKRLDEIKTAQDREIQALLEEHDRAKKQLAQQLVDMKREIEKVTLPPQGEPQKPVDNNKRKGG